MGVSVGYRFYLNEYGGNDDSKDFYGARAEEGAPALRVGNCGHLGVEEVQRIILRECGVHHSRVAIEQRASNLRISLKKKSVCPECGAVGAMMNKISGMCERCSARQNVEEARAFNAILREELAEIKAETERLNREYARYRQQNSRICRKNGLRGKRERQGE